MNLQYCDTFTTAPEPHVANGQFGYALAAGNFNGTEVIRGDEYDFDDLAVGAPGAAGMIGRVYVRPGTEDGVFPSTDYYYIEADVPDTDERFGQQLASGDLQNDGVDDLIIGAPDSSGGRIDIVAPAVPDEDDEPLAWPIDTITESFTQSGLWSDNPGLICSGCTFGQTIATGDFNGDHLDDIAVGVKHPYSSTGGYVTVRFGANTEFGYPTNPSSYSLVDQEPVSANTLRDQFGFAMTPIDLWTQDLLGQGFDDLAIAAVADHYDGISDTGIVIIAMPVLQDGWGELSGVFQATSTQAGYTGTVRLSVSHESSDDVRMRMWVEHGVFAFETHDCHSLYDGGTAYYERGQDIVPAEGSTVSGAPPSFSGDFVVDIDPASATISYTVTAFDYNSETNRWDGLEVDITGVEWWYSGNTGTCPTFGPELLTFARVSEDYRE